MPESGYNTNLITGDTTPPHRTDIKWWPPKHVWLASGWYASYWDAFSLCAIASFMIHFNYGKKLNMLFRYHFGKHLRFCINEGTESPC